MIKNGFTFVELLGVIAVLAIISTVVTVAVDKNLKESKDTLYIAQIENIRSAARMWMTDNIENIPDSGYLEIYLYDLYDAGYLDRSVINPKTNENFEEDMIIKISMDSILVERN